MDIRQRVWPCARFGVGRFVFGLILTAGLLAPGAPTALGAQESSVTDQQTRSIVGQVVDAARGFFRLDREQKDRVAPPSEFDFRGYLGMDTTALAARRIASVER